MAKQKSFLNAMKWSYAGNWGEKAFAALFTFLLAGILGPHDFGLVSIAAIYISFLQLFLDQGFATALIQRKNLEPEHLDAVFWMNVGLSIVLIVVSLLFAYYWAAFNHAPEAAVIIAVLSLSILLHSLTIVQTSILRKNMDFRILAIRGTAAVVISGIAGVGFALAGFGAWALVVQQLVRDASTLVLLWKLSPWRPRFSFSWKHLRDLMGFSVPNFVAQLGIFVDGQAGMIALGLLFGPIPVGFYRLAERVTSCVVSMTMSATQAVSLPEFARHQDNPAGLRKAGLTCIRLASTVSVPALAGLAAVSHPLMAIIGPQWAPAAGVLRVLCVVSILVIFTFFTGPLLQALGRTRALAGLEWGRTAVGLICLVVAGLVIRNSADSWQIMGIAIARLATAVCFTTPFFLYLFFRLCGLSLLDFIKSVAPSALASLGVVGAVLLFQSTGWLSESKPTILLTVEVLIGVIAGVPILLVLDDQLRSFSANLLRLKSKPGGQTTSDLSTQTPIANSLDLSTNSRRLRTAFVPIWNINPYHAELTGGLARSNVDVWTTSSLKDVYHGITLKGEPMDVLHLQALPYLEFGRDGLGRYCRFFWRITRILKRNIPVAWTVHEIDNHDSRFRRTETIFMQFLSRRVDAIIVHGKTAKSMVAQKFGISEDRIHVIAHGNYIKSYENKISRGTARASLGLDADALVMLFFGHLRPYKGVLEMVAAFRKIDNPNLSLVISGLPINNMETEIGLAIKGDARIKFMPGRVKDSEVQVLMNACDIVVLPYKRILTSGAAVLAMSFGKPCIAPRLGCVTDMLDETGAIFFDPSIDTDLERALKEAVSSQKLAAMGLHNLNKATAWEWDGIAQETAAIYRQCIAARKK